MNKASTRRAPTRARAAKAAPERRPTGSAPRSLATTVAKAFAKIGPRLRVEVLSRLLSATGPMALAVIGGGMFAKYIGRARWPEVAVSPEDAARITSRQILDLARYVEQSDPPMLRKVVALLSTDIAALAVFADGASPRERQPAF